MKNKLFVVLLTFAIWLSLPACAPRWEVTLMDEGQSIGAITEESVTFYVEKSTEAISAVPLGQLLYHHGFTLVDEISFVSELEEEVTFSWDPIAGDATINTAGQIILGDQSYTPQALHVTPANLASAINLSIMDIAPTMTNALVLPNLPDVQGKVVFETKADHGILLFLDGLQYQKLISMIDAGKLPFFQGIEKIQCGLTVYPSITTSASASLLTGAPPSENGVFGYGYRTTEMKTLFDQIAQEGRSALAIEGYALAFNLRNAETTLSGDRDGDGFTDDNVFENSLEVIHSGMPDLLYVHFHEIDDMGHTYGPDSSEYEAAVIRVDSYLAEIYQALPRNTFIIIFTDHGMHPTQDGGNHGSLTASDMIIPMIFLEK